MSSCRVSTSLLSSTRQSLDVISSPLEITNCCGSPASCNTRSVADTLWPGRTSSRWRNLAPLVLSRSQRRPPLNFTWKSFPWSRKNVQLFLSLGTLVGGAMNPSAGMLRSVAISTIEFGGSVARDHRWHGPYSLTLDRPRHFRPVAAKQLVDPLHVLACLSRAAWRHAAPAGLFSIEDRPIHVLQVRAVSMNAAMRLRRSDFGREAKNGLTLLAE